jgi:hypothetical protein
LKFLLFIVSGQFPRMLCNKTEEDETSSTFAPPVQAQYQHVPIRARLYLHLTKSDFITSMGIFE